MGSSVGRTLSFVCRTNLSLQVCFSGASCFLLLPSDSFASVAMMKKHSMNPFILRISSTKSSCVRLTDRRAFTRSSCQQHLFCGEPVNFVDARLVNKRSHPPKRTHSLCGMNQAGASVVMNRWALERLLLYFLL